MPLYNCYTRIHPPKRPTIRLGKWWPDLRRQLVEHIETEGSELRYRKPPKARETMGCVEGWHPGNLSPTKAWLGTGDRTIKPGQIHQPVGEWLNQLVPPSYKADAEIADPNFGLVCRVQPVAVWLSSNLCIVHEISISNYLITSVKPTWKTSPCWTEQGEFSATQKYLRYHSKRP